MKQFTLPKSCLLRKTGEYNLVYRNGTRLRGRGFTLVCLGSSQPSSRLGISIQAKTGSAVRRNRIKRIIRETFRLHREIFPASHDIVFAVRPEFSIHGMNDVRAAVAVLTGLPEQHDEQV
ncbi:ribonuclease P protein component [Candidatus Electronema sp. PJ]|uniref:ribonuclease P protein component n=1 Tax=Candidatus Electronema sp. PJ TaxID=3401572 RepID=UPI003AA8886F